MRTRIVSVSGFTVHILDVSCFTKKHMLVVPALKCFVFVPDRKFRTKQIELNRIISANQMWNNEPRCCYV